MTHILDKAKLWRQKKNHWWPGIEWWERGMRRWNTGFQGSEAAVYDMIMVDICPLYICPNPQNGHRQE